MKKYFISYGDEKYEGQKERLRAEALSSSFFDEIEIFSPKDIDGDFNRLFFNDLKSLRGGGFWIWKPYVVKKVFDRITDNDFLIYCDAGCTINSAGKKRFEEYIELLTTSKNGIIGFDVHIKEYLYTKQEVFDYFKSSEEIVNSNQLVGGIILLRKCAHTAMLVDKWYNTAVNYPFLFTDEKRVSQHPDFIDHRHDQSIFSVIRKIYGADILPDETYFRDFNKDGALFPIWATRKKG